MNLIEEQNRLILVFDDKPAGEIQGQENTVVGLLEQQSGLIVGVERIAARQWTRDNITLETDPSSTDFWFYAVDPVSELILYRNNSYVQR